MKLVIRVVVAEQMLYHRRRTGVTYAYPISTASRGTGNQEGSFKTPLGKHRIYRQFGNGLPMNTFFLARQPKGIFTQAMCSQRQDWILSRIIWLEGCQTGLNRRGNVDSRHRYIYIHGTNEESLIGSAASHGCIRMHNMDIIHLFAQLHVGETVLICP